MNRNQIDLLTELVKSSFKMRYQNSVLGFLWVLIKPYAMFTVLFLIFSNIIRANVENYGVYLLTGVIFITFINEILVLGQMSLLERANIILKVNFPRYIAIISALMSAVINLVINLILVFIISLVTGVDISFIGIIYLLFIIVIMFIGGLGISFFLSILTVKYRDLKNIVELLLFILQYATPIFYVLDNSFISNKTVHNILNLNPLTHLLGQFRASIGIYGEMNIGIGMVSFLISIILLIVGYAYFKRNVRKIAEFI